MALLERANNKAKKMYSFFTLDVITFIVSITVQSSQYLKNPQIKQFRFICLLGAGKIHTHGVRNLEHSLTLVLVSRIP